MRILIATALSLDYPSAAGNRLRRMALALRMHGIQTVLVGMRSFDTCTVGQEHYAKDGLAVHVFPSPRFRSCIPRYIQLMRSAARYYAKNLVALLEQYQIDLVIIYSYYWQFSHVVWRICRQRGVAVCSGMVEWFAPTPRLVLTGQTIDLLAHRRLVLPQLDGLIGISRFWVDWAVARGLPTVCIPSFAEDHGVVRVEPSPPGRLFTLTYMGHWIDRELPCNILQAMRMCIDRGVPVRMNLLGNIGKSYRERKAMRFLDRDEVLKQYVSFLGFVSDEERNRYLADADAFVLLRSDNRETEASFPTRLPEYMLTANPVILSEVGSFSEYFKHREDVWFISKENCPEELANAFEYLAKNPFERLAIGRRGRESALRQFSMAVLGMRLSTFLDKIMTRYRHKRSIKVQDS